MSPFLEEDDDDYNDDYSFEPDKKLNVTGTDHSFRTNFFRDEKKFFIIGGIASVTAFCFVAYFMYSGSKPVDLDDLPIIKADPNPIKVRPKSNEQVDHQDKVVYDNIADIKRNDTKEKTASPPEEILSIPEMDTDESLSQKEKDNIIQAFDDLAPKNGKNYKINYVKTNDSAAAGNNIAKNSEKVDEVRINADTINDSRVRQVDSSQDLVIEDAENSESVKNKGHHSTKQPGEPKYGSANLGGNKNRIAAKKMLRDIVRANRISNGTEAGNGAVIGNTMVQIASVHSKTAAETEYRRISNKNKFLKGLGKKIVKTDLGVKKGVRYRVQIGPFRTKAEAKKIISALRANGLSPYITK
ncbi:MAG: SPOR domain-containing protein [Holosporaceae bacterium]|jgi:cell division septation protein DedD|nr:SPOR domain-containing protein [Holosporaceae bacterium]